MHSFQILLLIVIIIEIVIFFVNIFRQILYKKTNLHYNVATFFMIIGQSCLFLIKDWKKMDHSFIYLNECQLIEKNNRAKCSPYSSIRDPIFGIDEGIISIHDLTIYQSLVMLLIYSFTIGHCLYAANKKKYDHSIKWIEYAISSSLQTMLLYSLFGQVAQTIWVVIGLKMFAMLMSYGIELALIHKKKESVLAKIINDKLKFFLMTSFVVYFFFHYGPLFVRNYSETKNINGKIENLESTDKPVWAYFFFGSIVLCESLFPYIIYKHRDNINSVNADVDFCFLSMISKITFNSVLIIGLLDKNLNKTWSVAGVIGGTWIIGGIIYILTKRLINNPSDVYKKNYKIILQDQN